MRKFEISLKAKLIFWALLIPTFLFPYLSAVTGAILFYFWHGDMVDHGVDLYLADTDRIDRHQRISVPGGPSFLQWQGQKGYPFHVNKLASYDWLTKLGLQKLSADLPYSNAIMAGQVEENGIDHMVSLSDLVRDEGELSRCTDLKEAWVYVSQFPMPEVFEWDAAFDQVVMEINRTPLKDKAEVMYVDCSVEGFLCHVWEVQAPALVHFQVLDELLEEDHEMMEGQQLGVYGNVPLVQDLRSVKVHVIDLPLDDKSPQIMPNTTFPSPRATLRALMLDQPSADVLEQFDEYWSQSHHIKRFNKYVHDLSDRNKALDLFYEVDNFFTNYVTTPLGMEPAIDFFHTLTFILTANAIELIVAPLRLLWQFFKHELLAMPKRGDVYTAAMERRDEEARADPLAGIFEGLF